MIFLLLSSSAFDANALPAKRGPMVVTQPDGSTITVLTYGDEFFHYTTTIDGYSIASAENGMFYYLEEADGTVRLSTVRANDPGNRSSQEKAALNSIRKGIVNNEAVARSTMRRNEAAAGRNERVMNRLNASAGGTVPTRADDAEASKVLVILVNYKDVSYQYTRQNMDELLNLTDYSVGGASGSAHDYFYQNSNGQFSPQFDVVGPVTISQNRSYYGGNDSWGNDRRPGEMVKEACQKAKSDFGVNFADYASDTGGGTKEVQHLIIIYAGLGEADTGQPDLIWPHEWALQWALGSKLLIDGVYVNTYACSPELKNDGLGGTLTGIGVICHEFGHVLGLPDFYDTDGSAGGEAETPHVFSFMDYGPYVNEGMTPPAMSSYERYLSGWLTYTQIYGGGQYTLEPLYDNDEAYLIATKTDNEFFVFENRNGTSFKWDTFMSGAYAGYNYYGNGSGLLIFHVDRTTSTPWQGNSVNNTASHPYYRLIKATSSASQSNIGGYFFPYGSTVTSFTSTSSPHAFKSWYSGATEMEIANIVKSGNNVIFTVTGGIEASLDDIHLDAGQFNITVSWEGTSGNTWKLTCSKPGEMDYIEATTDGTSWNFDNLVPGTEYEISVTLDYNPNIAKTKSVTTGTVQAGSLPLMDVLSTQSSEEYVILKLKDLQKEVGNILWRVRPEPVSREAGGLFDSETCLKLRAGTYCVEAEVVNKDNTKEYFMKWITVE